ncbi:CopG family transcriptional regulator [Halorussus salilacus]|nr:CopG family transcriptional regulator [Halorussus salilacus]USZ67508.1 CopG family transcriptional regulator [Halorussus salilacus]
MERRYSVTCDRDLAKRIDALAHDYDLTTQEVLQQLIVLGLEEIDDE